MANPDASEPASGLPQGVRKRPTSPGVQGGSDVKRTKDSDGSSTVGISVEGQEEGVKTSGKRPLAATDMEDNVTNQPDSSMPTSEEHGSVVTPAIKQAVSPSSTDGVVKRAHSDNDKLDNLPSPNGPTRVITKNSLGSSLPSSLDTVNLHVVCTIVLCVRTDYLHISMYSSVLHCFHIVLQWVETCHLCIVHTYVCT